MPASYFIGFVILIIVAGVIWKIQISRLGSRLFGQGYRVRYVPSKWIIEAGINGRVTKYATGGMGFVPALTYLFLETEVSKEFSVKNNDVMSELSEQIANEIVSLQSRNGFKRIDMVKPGAALFNTMDRVSFLHPGEGILLRRYTKHGGDADFIRKDIESLQKIADAMTQNN